MILKIIASLNVIKYLRPAEVDTLKGDFSKARKVLKWKPKHNIKSLVKDMISMN